jgi:hypothetical protein
MTGLLLESADRSIAAIARTQYGLIATRQARTAGLQQHHLKQRVASGQLVAVRRGVLRVAGTPACWEQSALGAVLAGGEDTLLSHGAAARGWRANRFAHALVEIVEPRRCSSALSDIRCHHSVVVQVDRRTVRGLPLTSPERTLCDLSGRMNADQLGRLADEWIRRHLMTADGARRVRGSAEVGARSPHVGRASCARIAFAGLRAWRQPLFRARRATAGARGRVHRRGA